MFWEICGLSTKTLQPNFGFVSVTNKNVGKYSPCQTETKIAKRLLTGAKPAHDKNEKTRKKVFVG
jgi:hypothetical protein